MTAFEQAVERAIKKHARELQINEIVSGIACNVTQTTCDVQRTDAADLLDVTLNALDDDLQSYLTIYPKEGSEVLAGIVEGRSTTAVLLRCGEVEKIEAKIGNTCLLMNAEGYTVSGGNENLFATIADLITEVQKIIVVQGTSPNVPALEQLKKRINKILK